MSSDENTKNIIVVMMFEIIGKPPEYLTETLDNLITKIDEEKGVKVKNKKINEPEVMKKDKNFYTNFAEIEVEVEEINDLALIIFKYMPAHIDVIYPEKIALTNNSWNEILNEITRRLHGYDEIARVIQFENKKMQKRLKELEENSKDKE
jgi:hypothetical protein